MDDRRAGLRYEPSPSARTVRSTNRETFRDRLAALQQWWSEHRRLAALASAHDRETQFQLLQLLHEWATEAADELGRLYADRVEVRLSPPPAPEQFPPAFTLALGTRYAATFTLSDYARRSERGWYVGVVVRGQSQALRGNGRQAMQWSRQRFDDILLGLVAEFERTSLDRLA